MPEEKAINKVIYGGNTLMDITDTTATESDVVSGEIFYLANGTRGVGTANYISTETDPTVPSWAKQTDPPTYALSYDENSIGSSYTDTAVTIEPNYTPSGDVKQTMETIEYVSGRTAVLDFAYSDYVLTINGVTLPEITTKKVATSAPTFIGSGVKFVINSNVNSNAVGTGAADYMEI